MCAMNNVNRRLPDCVGGAGVKSAILINEFDYIDVAKDALIQLSRPNNDGV